MSYKEIKENNTPPYKLDFDLEKRDPCENITNIVFEVNKIQFIDTDLNGVLPLDDSNERTVIDFNFDINDPAFTENDVKTGSILLNINRRNDNNILCCDLPDIQIKVKNESDPTPFELLTDTVYLYGDEMSSHVKLVTKEPVIINPEETVVDTDGEFLVNSDSASNYTEKLLIPFEYSYKGAPCFSSAKLQAVTKISQCRGNEVEDVQLDSPVLEIGLPCGSSLDTENYPAIPLSNKWSIAPASYNLPVIEDADEEYFIIVEYDNKVVPDVIAVVKESAIVGDDQDCGNSAKNDQIDITKLEGKLPFLKSNGSGFVEDDEYKNTYFPLNGIDRNKGDSKSPYQSEDLNGRGMLYLDYEPLKGEKSASLRIFTRGWSHFLEKLNLLKTTLNYNQTDVRNKNPDSDTISRAGSNQVREHQLFKYVDNGFAFDNNGVLVDEEELYNVTSYNFRIHCPIPKSLYPNGPLTVDLYEDDYSTFLINTESDENETNAVIRLNIQGGNPPYTVKVVGANCCGTTQTFTNINRASNTFDTNSRILSPARVENGYQGFNFLHQSTNTTNNSNGNTFYYDDNIASAGDYTLDLSDPNKVYSDKKAFLGNEYNDSALEIARNIDSNIERELNRFNKRSTGFSTSNNTMTIMVWDTPISELSDYNIGEIIHQDIDSANPSIKAFPDQRNRMFQIIPFVSVYRTPPVDITRTGCGSRSSLIVSNLPPSEANNYSLTLKRINTPLPSYYTNITGSATTTLSPSEEPCKYNDAYDEEITITGSDIATFETNIEAALVNGTRVANLRATDASNFRIDFSNFSDLCPCGVDGNGYEVTLEYGTGNTHTELIQSCSNSFTSSSGFISGIRIFNPPSENGVNITTFNSDKFFTNHPGELEFEVISATFEMNDNETNYGYTSFDETLLNSFLNSGLNKGVTITAKKNDSNMIDKLIKSGSSVLSRTFPAGVIRFDIKLTGDKNTGNYRIYECDNTYKENGEYTMFFSIGRNQATIVD